MFGALLGPFLPYIAGGAAIVIGAALLYVKLLRSKVKKLTDENAALALSHKANLEAFARFQEETKAYVASVEAANRSDTAQAKTKADKISAAKDVAGADTGKVTQADLDAINKKKGK